MATRQLDLLEQPASTPDGFLYRPNLISSQEEAALLERVRGLPFKEFEFQGYRGKRRVVSFGLHYDFARGKLETAAERQSPDTIWAKSSPPDRFKPTGGHSVAVT